MNQVNYNPIDSSPYRGKNKELFSPPDTNQLFSISLEIDIEVDSNKYLLGISNLFDKNDNYISLYLTFFNKLINKNYINQKKCYIDNFLKPMNIEFKKILKTNISNIFKYNKKVIFNDLYAIKYISSIYGNHTSPFIEISNNKIHRMGDIPALINFDIHELVYKNISVNNALKLISFEE